MFNKEQKQWSINLRKMKCCNAHPEPTIYNILISHSFVLYDFFFSRSKDEVKMPYTLQLGDKKITPVVEDSIIGMCVNEQRKITVPPHHAYGDKTIKFKDGLFYYEIFIFSGEGDIFSNFHMVFKIVRKDIHPSNLQNNFQSANMCIKFINVKY